MNFKTNQFKILAMEFFLFGLILIAPTSRFAEAADSAENRLESKKSEVRLIVQVLFELNKEAITTTDFKNFLKTKQELKIKNLLTLVQNELEEFILYKLVYLEVKNIELKLTEAENLLYKNDHQKKMILVQNYLSSKERHLTQLNRYKVWTDILKRKYNYLARIEELKN